MSPATLSKLRNFSIIAHHGAGKTLLTEALLFNARAIDVFSAMGGRPCPLDEDPEEQERGMTLSPQIYNFRHNECELNLIDTPGYINFLADTRYSLMASDAAVLIVSALSGVKETSMDFWEAISDFERPRFLFVNKMDREKANFVNALASIEQGFEIHPVCFTIPMGAEHNLIGVIDLLRMKALKYSSEKDGRFQEVEIPGEFLEEARSYREKLMESIIETNDELMNAYLEGKEISFDQLLPLLRDAIAHKQITPVFAGSAALNMGLHSLLNAICDYFPSPEKHKKEWHGKKPVGDLDASRTVSSDAPMSGFVFKTTVDHFAGKVNYCRLVSGTIKSGDTFLITNQDQKARVVRLAKPFGRKLNKLNDAAAGEIIALEKIDLLETNDTISSPSEPIIYPSVERPDRLISCCVMLKDKASQEKVTQALHKVMEEDPNIEYRNDPETKELILTGMGQFHLEIVKQRLKRKYDVTIDLAAPKVPYKETIKGTAKAQGKYKKQSGGHGQYGDCWIEISSLPSNGGFEFVNNIVGGVIPRNFIPSVEKGVKESMKKGYLAGYSIVDLKASVYDGSYHAVDSSDIAFKIAATMAFKKCMESAKPVLLEPIMDVKVTVPSDNLGAVIRDINNRRGRVAQVEPKAEAQIIWAKVPLAEMLTYDNTLKGMTQGKGIFTMHQDTYEEVPSPIASKIIQDKKAEQEKPKENNNK